MIALFLCAGMGFLSAVIKPKNNTPPAWISNPMLEYPAKNYLSGVGIGATTALAEKKALASLAQFFETTVKATTTTSETENSETENQITQTKLQSSFANQIETFSTAKIQFAEVVKTWQNPENNNFYVLMVINKAKACEIYAQQIANSEHLLSIYLAPVESPLLRFANLRKALSCSQEAEPSYYYYNALADPKFPMKMADQSTGEIEAMKYSAGQAICFQLSIQGDSLSIIRNSLEETTRKMGFSYGSESELQMQIKIVPAMDKVMGKQIFASYSATIQLYYQDKQIFTLSDQVQQGDTTLLLAKSRAIKALSTSISQKFKKEFNKYLEQM